ncbi:MAG: MXAN_2562 family outer membrane beta-barrel protein, partial [Polyangiaceae bacterium]
MTTTFRPRFLLASSIAALAASLWTRGASAQGDDGQQSWRAPRVYESPQRFAFELRFGPYIPQIDQTFPRQRPYETVFGTDQRVMFGLEFDWQLARIPYVGTIGPGIGWSYTHMSATAFGVDGKPTVEETGLGIMPMYGVGVLRIDELARQTGIPLVGYGKAGLGYALWWTGNDTETQRRGHTWGTQFALGGMFLLDIIDNKSATEIDNEWGINNSYVFFEWM